MHNNPTKVQQRLKAHKSDANPNGWRRFLIISEGFSRTPIDAFAFSSPQAKTRCFFRIKRKSSNLRCCFRCRRWVIFPGRRQPSIVTVNELNYCVRNGNRCTLVTINTYYFVAHSCAALLLYHTISLLSTSFLKKFGDPWENRTPVCGVRGRRLSRLTNGP